MSEFNEYVEGEKLAEIAVRDRIGRKQLETLSRYSARRSKEGIDYWLKKQTARGMISVGLMNALDAVLGKCGTSIRFAKAVAVAADLYTWKETEPTASALDRCRGTIENAINEYAARNRLGKSSFSIRLDRGRVSLALSFDKNVIDPARAAREIRGHIVANAPQLQNTDFQVWIERPEVREYGI